MTSQPSYLSSYLDRLDAEYEEWTERNKGWRDLDCNDEEYHGPDAIYPIKHGVGCRGHRQFSLPSIVTPPGILPSKPGIWEPGEDVAVDERYL